MNQDNFKIRRSFLAEVNLPTVAAGNTYYFADIPQLRNVYTYGIEAVSDTQLSKTPLGFTVAAAAQIKTATVVLTEMDTNVIYQMPYYTLVASLNGGYIRTFNFLRINLVKSYIQLVDTGITATNSLAFNFYYQNQPPDSKKKG